MKKIIKISLLFLFCGSITLTGQGEFYTINHDTKIMLKSSKKENAVTKYYDKDDLEDLLIFREGIDRPIKLKGNIDFLSSNVDFDFLRQKHIIPLESLDSVYVGLIHDDLNTMIVDKYVNGNLFGNETNYFLQLLVDGEVQLYKRRIVKIRRANYNRALDIGNKKETCRIQNEYFLYTEQDGLFKVPKKNKSLLRLISFYEGAASFFKKRKLSCKEEEDLKLLITYINKK